MAADKVSSCPQRATAVGYEEVPRTDASPVKAKVLVAPHDWIGQQARTRGTAQATQTSTLLTNYSQSPVDKLSYKKNLMLIPQVEAATGMSRSTLYRRVCQGLWTRPHAYSTYIFGWLMSDVAALLAARAARLPENQIRSLVEQLEAGRTALVASLEVAHV